MNPNPSPIPDCHLQFIGATVGLLKAVVPVAVRKPTRAQWSLVPAARRSRLLGPASARGEAHCENFLSRIARAGSKLRGAGGAPGLAGASPRCVRKKLWAPGSDQ